MTRNPPRKFASPFWKSIVRRHDAVCCHRNFLLDLIPQNGEFQDSGGKRHSRNRRWRRWKHRRFAFSGCVHQPLKIVGYENRRCEPAGADSENSRNRRRKEVNMKSRRRFEASTQIDLREFSCNEDGCQCGADVILPLIGLQCAFQHPTK